MALYTYIDYLKRNLRCRIARGKKVIDIGSGHAPLIRADFYCDMFPLDATERAVSAIFMPAGRFIIGDIMDLPFKDKSFDFSCSRATLEHVPDPLLACREISRISREGIVIVPSSLWETMGGSPLHLWLISEKDGNLVFKRKTPEDAALNARIPERIRDSREYEKLFMHFYADFFIEHRWKDSLRAVLDGPNDGVERAYRKIISGQASITEENIRDRVERRNGFLRKIRHALFSLLRALQGGGSADLLLSVIACPACKNGLVETGPSVLTCDNCRLAYPFFHGVPVLLRDHAKALP